MPGTSVGAYEVIGLVGTGGMGEVYKARDPRLNRLVALKILPDDLAADARRRERFRRESHAIAALSHPNIVTIYEADEIDGRLVIAMELLEGKTLAELIPRGGLPVDRHLKLAVQIADALGAAHERGIVHRDLKPRNVMVSDDGRVKVLDFGLAMLREAANDPATTHPTAPLWELTGEGRVVGTAAYMSPEQADGRPLDHRTDLFSFGIVLHEMAVGERPFQGDSIVSVLAAIVRDTPRPLTEINPRLPRELTRVVRRCLAKDREERYQSARDIGHDLTDLRQELRSGESGERAAVQADLKRRRVWMAAGVAMGVAAAALAGIAASRWRPAASTALRPVEARQLTFEPGVESLPSLSPDGRWVIYTHRREPKSDIFLQAVGGDRPINLTAESESGNGQAAFSWDGERIAFRSARQGGGLFVMGRTGDFVRRVIDEGYNPSWSPDDKSLAYGTIAVFEFPYSHIGGSTLWRVQIDSGERRQLVSTDAVQPAWSPNGWRIAYWGIDPVTRHRDIWTVPATGGPSVPVTRDRAVDAAPTWSRDGRSLVFASDRGGTLNLWRIAIDEKTGAVQGAPEAITVPVEHATRPTLSRDGERLAYTTVAWAGTVSVAPFDPKRGVLAGEEKRLLGGPHLWSGARVSPDGRRLLLGRTTIQHDLFLFDLQTSAVRRLTDIPGGVRCGEWSPDGSRIVFLDAQRGDRRLRFVHPDTGAVNDLEVPSTGLLACPVWSPDGGRVALQQGPEDPAAFVVSVGTRPENGGAVRLPPYPGAEFIPRAWSADGKMLAGTAADHLVLYEFDAKRYITFTGGPDVAWGGRIVWLPDNRRLLVQGEGAALLLIDSATKQHQTVWPAGPHSFRGLSLSPDGRQLFIARGPDEGDVWVATLR
jgi:Tol biopolymer transport system component/tRNA A-37 threonylcarbamoyl transferase component Bud32